MGNTIPPTARDYLCRRTDTLVPLETSELTLLENRWYPLERRLDVVKGMSMFTLDDKSEWQNAIRVFSLLRTHDEECIAMALCYKSQDFRAIARAHGSIELQELVNAEFRGDSGIPRLKVYDAMNEFSKARREYVRTLDTALNYDFCAVYTHELVSWDAARKKFEYEGDWEDLQSIILEHDLAFTFAYAATPKTIAKVCRDMSPPKCFEECIRMGKVDLHKAKAKAKILNNKELVDVIMRKMKVDRM